MSFVRTYVRAIALLGPEKPIAAWIAFAGVVLALLQFLEPILFGRVVDALAANQPPLGIVALWAGLGFVAVAANIFVALQADRLAHRRRLQVMARYFEHVVALPAAFHSEAQSGRLIGVMLRGTDNLAAFWLSGLREQLTAAVALLILIPAALVMNWRMALLLVALMVIYGVLNVVVVHKTHFGQSAAELHHAELSGRVGDVIGNVSIVQSFARVAEETEALQQVMRRLLAAQFPVLTWWAIMTVLTKAAATITIVCLFALGALLHARGETTVGEIVSFIGFANLLIGRLDQLTSFASRLVFQAPAMAEFYRILEERSSVPEAPDAKPLVVSDGEVRFEDVTFRYAGGSPAGVADITLTARPGETIAIVGPTGSGKSTLMSLLLRVRDPEKGRILIDGQDIRTVTLESLRRAIGIVFQEPGLFDRSLAENLRVGKPTATDEEIERAARLAEADQFIREKIQGYETRAGERGRGLSGGERQRLAIARAILKDAPILVLDEATSALDTETEARIKRALDRLSRGRTTFIIAHRLSTVRTADRIVFLEGGRIVETGTYAELSARSGRFAALIAAGELTVPSDAPGAEKRAEAQAAAAE